MLSALATEEVHLQEGCQQLESLVHAAKAFYDRYVARVEWECSALDAERVEAIVAREETTKALRELEGQREAFAILKVHTEEIELELASREAVVTEREEAAAQRKGVLRMAKARGEA
ncbi:hypothetical protein E2562_017481 [Oryza meyeriana var. granulata]|uniref:Uncharacterized protein n=1 Tax=Oryza meyeriana var. granulata TaxID=110450 RepID=A0A6G1DWS3_9ORYZ|nr:hypothetical protein E2562_017481 [Oryza meyeriana var. granulata]